MGNFCLPRGGPQKKASNREFLPKSRDITCMSMMQLGFINPIQSRAAIGSIHSAME